MITIIMHNYNAPLGQESIIDKTEQQDHIIAL